MCTLAVYRGTSPFYPLIVVANRDEFLGREATAPAAWPDAAIVAGRDLVAGGTWLGCRTDGSGRIVGLLNRRPAPGQPGSGPGEISRGLLCADALRARSVEEELARLGDHEVARYGGFNLFLADLKHALVVDNGQGARSVPLEEGLSVLTNQDVNDPRCPRLATAWKRFAALEGLLAGGADVDSAVPALAAVLADHEGDVAVAVPDGSEGDAGGRGGNTAVASPFSKVCVHMGEYGTRSSSMIFMRADGRPRYFHAEGPPCRTPFEELSL
jgi:uncharacterized protein with NRDE domain